MGQFFLPNVYWNTNKTEKKTVDCQDNRKQAGNSHSQDVDKEEVEEATVDMVSVLHSPMTAFFFNLLLLFSWLFGGVVTK
mmetsp:Transcript_22294/g.46486  ORF Transcript_22294/g.46486 Transcript_22294/m.46486 type:complete len:80 (-) Transcript_22294:91-330(-)